ncbi:MAG TPA: hypothetical protein DHW63_08215 [Hyphomonadaceae bacterium]|nr:hypothetical protein [Hyphomonadaceae bacterium]
MKTPAWPIAASTLALIACADEPMFVADRLEVEAHREFVAVIRGVDACGGGVIQLSAAYGGFVNLTVEVDPSGHARLLDVPEQSPLALDVANPNCRKQLEVVTEAWRYRPFERDGLATKAQFAERALILPAERWRVPRRQFPAIANPDFVLITLTRSGGWIHCESERSRYYRLQIHGDGNVTITSPMPGPDAIRRQRIDPAVVENLVEQFRAADFFSFEEEYHAPITDQPRQTLTFEAGQVRASVSDYVGETVGMPLVVRDLEVAVDAAAGLEPLRCGGPDTVLQQW